MSLNRKKCSTYHINIVCNKKPEITVQPKEHKAEPLKREELSHGNFVAGGSRGTVWHGRWNGKEVAIKSMSSYSADLLKACENERKILKKLCKLHAPNVVQYLGYAVCFSSYMLVMEYLKGGSLEHYIPAHPAPAWQVRYKMMRDITGALNFMHQNGILYCDMKCNNVLVGENAEVVKLCDFGLSKKVEQAAALPAGYTINYCAPELLHENAANTKESDVYALALTLWSVAAWKAFPAVRQPVPADCSPGIANLITLGWNENPAVRPSVETFLNELNSVCAEQTCRRAL